MCAADDIYISSQYIYKLLGIIRHNYNYIYTVGANIMFPCEVHSLRTSPEVRTKLRRSLYEVVE